MFRFEYTYYLWFLVIIPLLIILRWMVGKKKEKQWATFGNPSVTDKLIANKSTTRQNTKFGLLLGALALLILILARPQMGTKVSHEKRQGIEIMMVLDISNSMLAQDVVPSRLDKSKLLIENLVDHLNNDKIGMVVFAGDAFVQLPITTDYVSAKMFLHNIDPSLIQTQGTDIGKAVDLAMHSFTQKKNIGRAIVLITDGEDHEGGAVEAVKKAKARGINVYVMGIGDVNGAPIPMAQGGYLENQSGETVLSKLNEPMCKELAQSGSGVYIHVDNTNDAQTTLNTELDKMTKGETDAVVYSEYGEQFQAFIWLALIVLVVEIMVMEMKNYRFRNLSLFKKRGVMLLLLMFTLAAQAQNDRSFIREGNRYFEQGNYVKAEVAYRKAVKQNPNNPQALYNLGNALMMQQKDSIATTYLLKAGKLETSKTRKAMVYHNIGVICQQHQLYGDAIEAYKESLRNNPNDEETRYNLALCKRQQKKQQQQQKQQQKQQKQNNNDQQNDKNKSQQGQKKQQNQSQMSKENAEQLLNAAQQQEAATKQRMRQMMRQPQNNRMDKNW